MTSPDASALLLLISAPSGGGKTTVCEHLLAETPGLSRAITCTTRPPREGERSGVDYYFVDPDTFARRVEAGEFLEQATVYGNRYGTLKAELFAKLGSGRDVLLSVDVQGAASIRAQAKTDPALGRALATVFLAPPSLAVLEERLQRRGTDAPAVIRRRLSVVREEIDQWRHFDYLVISGSMAEDLRRMKVVYEAEKLRQFRALRPPGL